MDVLPSGTGIALSSATPAWQNTLDLTKMSTLFSFYPSKGNATIATATNIPSLLDGPIQVARYGTLTVNAALSVTNRCRGLLILCDSLTMGADGKISMDGKGAAGSVHWANQDIGLTNVRLSGQNTSYRNFATWLADNGYAIFDPTLFACPLPGMGDVQADYANWPAYMTPIIDASGCGAGAVGAVYGAAGVVGGVGTSAPGGGGSGAGNSDNVGTTPGGPGRVWGGGVGSGGAVSNYGTAMNVTTSDLYGGKGGQAFGTAGAGAGNPAGNDTVSGTGGILIIIVRGNVTLTTGHKISAAGVSAPTVSGIPAGGSSGGGRVVLIYGGALTGTPNLSAAGGTSTSGSNAGGAGGAGDADVTTFAAMGWS